MKIINPITLWDRIDQAIMDLTDQDEPLEKMTELQSVERLIELAHEYRLKCRRLEDEIEEITWQ